MDELASSPGYFRGRGKEPGIHCMRMRVIATEFRSDRIFSEYIRILMTSLLVTLKGYTGFSYTLRVKSK